MRDTIELAREAGADTLMYWDIEKLKRFESLVRADEREKAIALQQHEDVLAPIGHSKWGEAYQDGWAEGTAAYREAIRARGAKHD